MGIQKIGMRTIKTGIAVSLCYIIGSYILDNLFFACVACIFAVQNTVEGSFKMGFNRIRGTIVGGIVGLILTCILPDNPILSGIGVMITIYICNLLKATNQSITVGSITFLAIYLATHEDSSIHYAVYRTIETSFGVIIGMVVNYFIARPNYSKFIIEEFKEIENLTNELVKDKLVNNQSIHTDTIYKRLVKLDDLYKKLNAELDYNSYDDKLISISHNISLCKEIYFHIQSIEFLNNECFLTKQNYDKIKSIYSVENIYFGINETDSPVFNHHVSKIINQLNTLKEKNEVYK